MMLQLWNSSNDTCLDAMRAPARAYVRVRIDIRVRTMLYVRLAT